MLNIGKICRDCIALHGATLYRLYDISSSLVPNTRGVLDSIWFTMGIIIKKCNVKMYPIEVVLAKANFKRAASGPTGGHLYYIIGVQSLLHFHWVIENLYRLIPRLGIQRGVKWKTTRILATHKKLTRKQTRMWCDLIHSKYAVNRTGGIKQDSYWLLNFPCYALRYFL